MAYIGKQPIVGNYQVLDALTATTTDTYALTKNSVAVFPQTPANCIVSLNGVIQAPFDSYTISGSNIVFASALTASDSIDFITVLGDVLNVGTVSDGTIGISKLSATGTPSSSTFLRGDNSWVSAGGANTPAFFAYKTGSVQSLSSGVITKVTFNTELFDTNNNFDNSTNYRFTPTTAGKYLFTTSILCYGNSGTLRYINVYIRENGSINFGAYSPEDNASNFNSGSVGTSVIYEMNGSTDYVEVYVQCNATSPNVNYDNNGNSTYFGGYKIIE